ncbi:MAG: DUF6599 family protein [Polyangiaceae bacterium]
MRRLGILVGMFVVTACGDAGNTPASAERRGSPPPPAVSVATSGSACVPSAPSDAPTKGFFPERVGAFCLQKDATTYGKDAKNPIGGICDLFDGECELYLGLAIERAIEVRYLSAPSGNIAIRLSRFDTPEHAFAMFSTRVVGDYDPAVDAPRPLEVGDPKIDKTGAGLGVGNVLFVKGAYLFEADFKDSTLSLEALKKAADALLPELAQKVAAALPAGELPALLASVPTADRVPLGVRFDALDALKLKGAGPAMLGYHKTADGRRYRTLVSKSSDAAHARNVFKLFAARALDPVGPKDDIARVELKEGALPLEWVLATHGEWVVGVGDESRVLRAGVTGPAHDDLCLPTDKKKQMVADWVKTLP